MTDPSSLVERDLSPDGKYLLLSDLHLGDGTPTDLFGGGASLLSLLEDQLGNGIDALILDGDIVDPHQAGSLERIRSAHATVIDQLNAIARRVPVLYVVGNHDTLEVISSLFPSVEVCQSIRLGSEALVIHGHELDVYFEGELADTASLGVAMLAHAWFERLTGQFVRLPFEDNDSPANRFAHWFFYRQTQLDLLIAMIYYWLGRPDRLRRWAAHHDYWARSQWGDSSGLLLPALAALADGEPRVLIAGHSHQAGVLDRFEKRPTESVSGEPDLSWRSKQRRAPDPSALRGRIYANLGSWTYCENTYGIWHDRRISVYDWPDQHTIGDQAYRIALDAPIIAGMREWWQRYYRSPFRYDIDGVRRDRLPLRAVK